MTRKTILTCAVTGANNFNRDHPNFPVTPPQIAAAAVEAARAGASIVHLHARDPETGKGVYHAHLFKEIQDRICDSGVDVVINMSAGGNARFVPDPDDESRPGPGTTVAPASVRYHHIETCRPEIASLDVTTANQTDGASDHVYLNTPRTLRLMAKRFQELGVKPELEVFGPGDILLARRLIDEGLIDGSPFFQFVLGVKWGAPFTPATILYLRDLLPANALWGALGIGREQMPVVAQSHLAGGHVRVGLEDNLYLRRGVFATNGQLVEQACVLIDALGGEVATPAEARVLLGLPSVR